MAGKIDMQEKADEPQPTGARLRHRALSLIVIALGWGLGFWAVQGEWMADEVYNLTTYHGWYRQDAIEYVLAAHGLWWNVGFIVFLLVISACLFLRADGVDRANRPPRPEENLQTTDDGLRVV